jgi:glycosyltransferase involved in cell wall biosynthesis
MNILFVLYENMACNSASHVDGLARELCTHGCDCVIAVPRSPTISDRFSACPYRVCDYAEVADGRPPFQDRRGPDLVHCWNPREIVRRFHARLAVCCSFRTVLHLEDNEEHISRCSLGERGFALAAAGLYPMAFPQHLTHPLYSRDFLNSVDGVSLVIESLGEMVPPDKPRLVLRPAVNRQLFRFRPRNDVLRRELNISDETCVVVYPGNTHSSNYSEVRSLYLAVALLNQGGLPTRLLRTGLDFVDQTQEYKDWASEHTIHFRYVDNQRLVELLSAADLFVQPGGSGPFNDYRLPSKLPEFFSIGRPVILPRTNIGLLARHRRDAYVVDNADGVGIRDAVLEIWNDQGLYEQLAEGAGAFADDHFCWKRSGEALLQFYRQVTDDVFACAT